MTDLEKTKKFFDELGVEYTEKSAPYFEDAIDPKGMPRQTLIFEQGNKKVIGYRNFCMQMYFDIDGKFVEMGIWE